MKYDVKDYDDALARLIANKPIRIAKGSKINNDNVSLEAGRKKGSIKSSRLSFSTLIEAIDKADKEQDAITQKEDGELQKLKDLVEHYREAMEAGLAREISLIREMYHVKKLNAKLTGSNIYPLRGTAKHDKENGQSPDSCPSA